MSIAHGAYYTFYTIYLVDHGYSKSLAGWLWALGVICEIGIFVWMPHLYRAFTLRQILLGSFALAVLRFLLIGWLIDNFVALVLAQALHAATFGSFHAASIGVIHKVFRGRHQARGQAIFASFTFGLGGTLGGVYAGYAWEQFGAHKDSMLPVAALAQTTVTTIGGGPSQAHPNTPEGSDDGNTLQTAQFNTPGGLVLDISGRYLFLADTVNGAIRRLDLTANNTITYLSSLSTPVDVALDGSTNLYVLTQGDGRIRQYDQFGQLIATNNATLLTTPTALAFDGSANLYVTELGGALKRVALSNGTVTTIVAPGTFSSPGGIEVLDNGTIAVSDTGNHVVRLVNPTSFAVTLLSGAVGTSGTNVGTSTQARFTSPSHLAKAGGNVLVVADQGNHRFMVVGTNGSASVLYGVHSNSWVNVTGAYPGWFDGPAEFAEARNPAGVVVDGSGNVFTTEQYYHLVRRATGSGLTGPSGVGTGGSSSVTLNPPSLSFSPNTGYFPQGTLITVTSSSTNVFYTTDGTAPTTNSTAVTMSSGTGVIRWSNPTNDLTGLRVAAFVFSGTDSASTNVTGVPASVTTLGVPAGVNVNVFAGVGARVLVPVVLNLRTNDTLRTLQFRLEVTPNGAAPMIGATFGAVSVTTNDFVPLTTGGSAANFSTLAYTAGTTRGLSISFLGTNANLLVNRFSVAALVAIPIPAGAAQGDRKSTRLNSSHRT